MTRRAFPHVVTACAAVAMAGGCSTGPSVDSSSTSGGDLDDATGHIAKLCGHPLPVGAFLEG